MSVPKVASPENAERGNFEKGKICMSYAKLRGRIREKFTTIQHFAEAMDLDTSTVSAKLNNKTLWKREEIARACELLGIPVEELHEYFFTPEVAI